MRAMITNKHKAYLLVSITFLLGVIVGASGQYLLSQRQAPINQKKTVSDITREIDQAAHLDPTQKVRIEEIMTDGNQQCENLRNQLRPQYSEIRLATRKRIRDLLSDEQKNGFDRWTRELDAKRAKSEAEEKNK